MTDAANVQTHAAVELQRVAAGRGLGIAEHHSQFLTQLVDEDAAGVRAADGGGEFSQCLAHQASLQAHLALAHLAFDFGFWCQSGHAVDDDDVDGAAADELVGNF